MEYLRRVYTLFIEIILAFRDLFLLQCSPDESPRKISFRHAITSLFLVVVLTAISGLIDISRVTGIFYVLFALITLWVLLSRFLHFTVVEVNTIFHVNLIIFWLGLTYYLFLIIKIFIPSIEHAPHYHFTIIILISCLLMLTRILLAKKNKTKYIAFFGTMLIFVSLFSFKLTS